MVQYLDGLAHRVEFEKCVQSVIGKEQDLTRVENIIFFHTIDASDELVDGCH